MSEHNIANLSPRNLMKLISTLPDNDLDTLTDGHIWLWPYPKDHPPLRPSDDGHDIGVRFVIRIGQGDGARWYKTAKYDNATACMIDKEISQKIDKLKASQFKRDMAALLREPK